MTFLDHARIEALSVGGFGNGGGRGNGKGTGGPGGDGDQTPLARLTRLVQGAFVRVKTLEASEAKFNALAKEHAALADKQTKEIGRLTALINTRTGPNHAKRHVIRRDHAGKITGVDVVDILLDHKRIHDITAGTAEGQIEDPKAPLFLQAALHTGNPMETRSQADFEVTYRNYRRSMLTRTPKHWIDTRGMEVAFSDVLTLQFPPCFQDDCGETVTHFSVAARGSGATPILFGGPIDPPAELTAGAAMIISISADIFEARNYG